MDTKANAVFLVESWRFWQTTADILSRLDSVDAKRLFAKSDYYKDCIMNFALQSGLKIDVPHGRDFNIGMPLQAINLSDFQPDETLYVSQVLQPTILDTEGKVVMEGKVMLAKQESGQ